VTPGQAQADALLRAGGWLFANGEALLRAELVIIILTVIALVAYRLLVVWLKLRLLWHGGSAAGGLAAWLRRPGRPGGAGGHSAEYEAVLHSAGWRRRRRAVLARQGGRCAVPGCTARAVDVHHAEGYGRLGRERPDELLGLCERHHGQLHGRG
jgi:hypothetical protein